jgi:sulfur carrier protein
VKLQLNGAEREVPSGADVASLVALLELPRDGVAVAVNGEVVPRAEHVGHALREGDRVELIRAVGGG